MLAKRWIHHECPPELRDPLCSELGISPITSNILINRGIKGADEANSFMSASLDGLHDPFLFKDMGRIVARIKNAFHAKEKVLIFGDYDADGITATSLLLQFFRKLGMDARFYIPDRLEEGYGISVAALGKIRDMGVSLVITVDCGVSSVEEVDAAARMGIDVIITDHHEPPDELPRAYGILNPCQKDSGYPFPYLAGVGVALKLAQGVLAGLDGKDTAGGGIDPRLVEYLDLAALGTIADMVPLFGENRVLVRHGLEVLKEGKRVGVRKLMDVVVGSGRFGAGVVGFQMAPRLNASGRLGKADLGVVLLTTDDPEVAAGIASELDGLNRQRQKIEEVILDDARSIITSESDMDFRTIVLASDRWHQGVIGVVASKLVEEYYRPTVLISMSNGVGKGSARSIPAFHLFNGLERCSGLLEGYGGHKFAAGLSIKREMLDSFKREFEGLVRDTLAPEDFVPSLKIEGGLSIKGLDRKLYDELHMLAPFGSGNPEPVLMVSRAEVVYPKIVGKNHVRMGMRQEGVTMGAIGFNMGEIYQSLAMGRVCVDAAFCLDMNEWQGEQRLQMNVKDLHF